MTRIRILALGLVSVVTFCFSSAASAQLSTNLVVTEMLANPISTGDSVWEWIEVKNTTASPIDLNGYIMSKLGETANTQNALPSVVTGNNTTQNSIIPAGGVAVLYDGATTKFQDAVFRSAWTLSGSVPLIGVSNWSGLPNTNTLGDGRSFGFWKNQTDYLADVSDHMLGAGGLVNSYGNTQFTFSYNDGTFPLVTDRTGQTPATLNAGRESMRLKDNVIPQTIVSPETRPNYQIGANWEISAVGVAQPSTKTSVITAGPQDVGNPGFQSVSSPVIPKPAKLMVTEIMYNPLSTEPRWEWFELYNNTSQAITFTNAVLDDAETTLQTAGNSAYLNGTIAVGQTAVVFNAGGSASTALTEAQFRAAWDPDGTRGLNLIAATATGNGVWQLNQGGDSIGIWPDFATYSAGAGRDPNTALVVQPYDDESSDFAGVTGTWPTDDGEGSIYLVDYQNPTVGGSWALSKLVDPTATVTSFNGFQSGIHPGDDVGSPGVFGPVNTVNADFDGQDPVEGNDFLIWQKNLGIAGRTLATGDSDGDGDADATDLANWIAHYGQNSAVGASHAVPEPASLSLGLVALMGLASLPRSTKNS